MHVLILGANSEVAAALANSFASREKAHLFLASRNTDLLEKNAQDLRIRFQTAVDVGYFDAADFDSHPWFYESLPAKPDIVVLAFGYLGDQQQAQEDFREARNIIDSNFTGAVSILEPIAADFMKRGHGVIIAISSVAGERGRQSNYLYGAAKGALTIYLSGLRQRLNKRGGRVITVLPGYIRTKMTEHLDLPEILSAAPEDAAEDIYRAYKKGKDVVYTKWFWKWIMAVIKSLPEGVFKRLSL